MDSELKKKIFEQYQRLPVALQQAIMSADLPNRFQEITKKHNLLLDQAASLETETLLILLGFEPYHKIAQNLESELSISQIKANEIARDVDEQILQKVREHLIGGGANNKIPTNNEPVPSLAQEITTLKQAREAETKIAGEENIIEIKPASKLPPLPKKETVDKERYSMAKTVELQAEQIPTSASNITQKNLVSDTINNSNNFLANRLQNTVVSNPERVTLKKEEGIQAIKSSVPEKKFDPYREPII